MQISNDDSPNQRRLYPVFTISTALAFGCMVATLEALRPDATGFSFDPSYKTVIAFIAGAAVVFPIWRVVLNGTRLGKRNIRFVIGIEIALLVLLGVGAFLYPLRFVPREKWPEIRTGLLTAIVALSCVGGLLIGVKRLLDPDELPESVASKQKSPPEKTPANN
jgi:hypothetical protein